MRTLVGPRRAALLRAQAPEQATLGSVLITGSISVSYFLTNFSIFLLSSVLITFVS
jgi:hypothetical protein